MAYGLMKIWRINYEVQDWLGIDMIPASRSKQR